MKMINVSGKAFAELRWVKNMLGNKYDNISFKISTENAAGCRGRGEGGVGWIDARGMLVGIQYRPRQHILSMLQCNTKYSFYVSIKKLINNTIIL